MTASNTMARLISRRSPRAAMRVPFGRKAAPVMAVAMPREPSLTDDMQLFASTFVGGLVFMMVYLA